MAIQALSVSVTRNTEHRLLLMYRRRLGQEHRAISQIYKREDAFGGSAQADETIIEMLLNRPERRSLRGTVLKYEEPLEPVAEDEWEAAQ